MKISQISVYQVNLPLEHPYKLSGGRSYCDHIDTTIVAIDTDEGIRGWGEGCPWGSTYLPAFARGVRAGIEELAPHLIGLDPRRIDCINRTMDIALLGHPYIKSALDIACWDILGKTTRLPLCELFGGRLPQPIILQHPISSGTPEEMITSIKRAEEKGYTIHSCKVGGDIARDLETIKVISSYLPSNESITFDANQGWVMGDAIAVMNAIKDDIFYFEQPCRTYQECLKLRRITSHPIILDECIHNYQDLVQAYNDGACEAISLKIGRVGGLTKAKRMRDFCLETGIKMAIAETGGSVIAVTGAVHLAQTIPTSHLRATALCHELFTVNTATGGARNQGGKTFAPEAPGLGLEPILSVLGDPIAVYK